MARLATVTVRLAASRAAYSRGGLVPACASGLLPRTWCARKPTTPTAITAAKSQISYSCTSREHLLDQRAEREADRGDERRPDRRAEEVEHQELPRGHAPHPEQDRPHDAEAVHEADRHDERRVPAREHRVEAMRAGLRVGKSGEDAAPVVPAEEEIELVARESRDHRDDGDRVEIEVAARTPPAPRARGSSRPRGTRRRTPRGTRTRR